MMLPFNFYQDCVTSSEARQVLKEAQEKARAVATASAVTPITDLDEEEEEEEESEEMESCENQDDSPLTRKLRQPTLGVEKKEGNKKPLKRADLLMVKL